MFAVLSIKIQPADFETACHMCEYVCIHVCAHVYVHRYTCIETYIYTYICTHAYTYTYALDCNQFQRNRSIHEEFGPLFHQFPEAKVCPLDSYNARVRFFPQGMCEDVGKLEKHILIQLPPHA